jgi:hypothetical protein
MMELPYEKGKINFIIGLFWPFKELMSGGVVALHKLAYKLAERGHNVLIFCEPEYTHPNIKVISTTIEDIDGDEAKINGWEPFSFNQGNTVSIYPEITVYNPFNTNNVARWILSDTKEHIEGTYGDNDVYFDYSDFKTLRNVKKRKLTVIDYKLDLLKVTNTGKRKSFCHIIHKHTPPDGEKIFKELGSFDLTGWQNKQIQDTGYSSPYDYLREMFNQYEYFLTYDQKSYHSIMATLCGCKTVILNPGVPYGLEHLVDKENGDSEDITPTEFRLNNPLQQYGIAYGWDDLKWANDTIHLVRDYVEQLEIIDDKTVDSFINYWLGRIL